MFNYGYSARDSFKKVKFGDDAGDEMDYQTIAEEIWAAWNQFKSENEKESQ